MQDQLILKTLLGRYPNTAALKDQMVESNLIKLDFDPAAKPAHAFKRVVRDVEFDVAELSVVTYLIAKSMGRPLTLLPAVMFSRMQHPYFVYDSQRGVLNPKDLAGKRIGVAYYTTATSTWLREILATDYGVDLSQLNWFALEDPHVEGFIDPPNVHRIPKESDLVDMLFAGELDAVIMTPIPVHTRLATVIPNPEAAASEWYTRHGYLQLNHMIVVKSSLVEQRPDVIRELWRMLLASKKLAETYNDNDNGLDRDTVPYGLEFVAPHLEAAIDCIHRQGLIPREYGINELCDGSISKLLNTVEI